ncbi:hypothetical protein [Chryseobacterium sp. R2A-55]|uniref:hypothetical protein n=1 Tax=Chryseobacterium sp. R2A-55 TaxID=2744445 RepID=UPI001F37CC75|nr:hypothetical protein [Chryseobacterium sp. R2A-55]
MAFLQYWFFYGVIVFRIQSYKAVFQKDCFFLWRLVAFGRGSCLPTGRFCGLIIKGSFASAANGNISFEALQEFGKKL